MSDETSSELFLIGLATLELVSDLAATSPVLLIADDAQWLDEPSCAVLAFVARRVAAERAAVLIAVRGGLASSFDDAELPELQVPGLTDEAAEALLDSRAPGLEPVMRKRLIAEADGNPLALVELPQALGSGQPAGGPLVPSRLPLTARLERAFAAQESSLPGATRTALLTAAADDSGVLSEVLAAASALEGTTVTVDALTPAVAARLVEIHETGLRQVNCASFAPHDATMVDFGRARRAPLLLVASGQDHVFPAITRSSFRRYRRSPAVTAYKEFPQRSHYTIGEPGWEQVADYALRWAMENASSQLVSRVGAFRDRLQFLLRSGRRGGRHPDRAPVRGYLPVRARPAGRPFRVHTAAAFTALIDALVVSLTALLPGDIVGLAAFAASIAGLSTTVGLTVLTIQRWPGRRYLRDLVAIPFLAAAYLVQLLDSTHLLASAARPGALRTQAVLVIVFFLIAIARAWQLIGGRGGMLLGVIAETARRHRAGAPTARIPSAAVGTEVTGLPRAPKPRSLSRTDRGACHRSSFLTCPDMRQKPTCLRLLG